MAEPASPTRVIIGASSQDYPGWLRTQQSGLDLVRDDDWERQFAPCSLSAVLIEHVWEHLAPDQARKAAGILYRFLAPGGYVRCAVPDGWFPNADYQHTVQVGGPGPADHPAASHKVVYTLALLTDVFAAAGFAVRPLEWWDEAGTFHERPWDPSDGFIYRSRRFDHRNSDGHPGFTSLIIDAVQPNPPPGGSQ